MKKFFIKFLLKFCKKFKNQQTEFIKISPNRNILFAIDSKFLKLFDAEVKNFLDFLREKNDVSLLEIRPSFFFKCKLSLNGKIINGFLELNLLKYDIAIVYAPKETFCIHKIINTINAKFKVSKYYDLANFADFLVYSKNSFYSLEDFSNFVETIKKYLYEI